jgi:hypothetical protein
VSGSTAGHISILEEFDYRDRFDGPRVRARLL